MVVRVCHLLQFFVLLLFNADCLVFRLLFVFEILELAHDVVDHPVGHLDMKISSNQFIDFLRSLLDAIRVTHEEVFLWSDGLLVNEIL